MSRARSSFAFGASGCSRDVTQESSPCGGIRRWLRASTRTVAGMPGAVHSFLTREKTCIRKLNEILLALKSESTPCSEYCLGAFPAPSRSGYPLRKLLVALEHNLLDHDSLEERLRREFVGIGSCRGQRAADFVLEPGGQ